MSIQIDTGFVKGKKRCPSWHPKMYRSRCSHCRGFKVAQDSFEAHFVPQRMSIRLFMSELTAQYADCKKSVSWRMCLNHEMQAFCPQGFETKAALVHLGWNDLPFSRSPFVRIRWLGNDGSTASIKAGEPSDTRPVKQASFCSPDVAKVLNHHFIPIKLDPEARPDVEEIST